MKCSVEAMSSAQSAWIESLPLEIANNAKCREQNIKFGFEHIDCVDNNLFFWSEGYSDKMLRVDLDTKAIHPIAIQQNVKIDSLKIICRNNRAFLLISENKLKGKLHFLSILNPQTEHFSYGNFSSNIIQIEHSSISSHTVYALTANYFHIIGLNDGCDEILYHDRIDVAVHNLIHFVLGTPKHLHNKLLSEYSVNYGFGQFAAYFVDKCGQIFVCSPIIPHSFQCSRQLLESLRFDFDKSFDFDLWIHQYWQIDIGGEAAIFNANAQFIANNKAIHRRLHKLNIISDEDEPPKNNAICTKLIKIDLDTFVFNEPRLQNCNVLVNIFPIFVRIWSDRRIDTVCCTQQISPSYAGKQSQQCDAVILERHYLENEQENSELFLAQKCAQNLDELLIGHNFDGLIRLKMKWLNAMPLALSEGMDEYLNLLKNAKSKISQIPLAKFETAVLSDLCVLDSDDFVILDEHNKQIRVFPLFNIKLNEIAIDDDDYKQPYDAQIDFDLAAMRALKLDKIAQCGNWKQFKKETGFSLAVPADFDLANPDSLRWFVENIKMKIEQQIFAKISLGHQLMNERREFIENQLNEFMIPQKQIIADKVKQISTNNRRLKEKLTQMIRDQKEMERKIEDLQSRIKQKDGNENEDKSELLKFQCVLQDFDKEYNASQFDYDQLEQIKIANNAKQANWTKKDLVHLQKKIKKSLTNSDRMLREMISGLQQLSF